MKLINIGFGNLAAADRIIAVVSPDSAPIKRMIQDARDKGCLIDACYGRKSRSVLFTDCGQIILTAVVPETISTRLSEEDKEKE
ncbi:MAG: DUF370 domain-containing protein [Clostridia bacterium]|nr:DUF370 domain-containing protein [Clostridia bacterium]